jgi:hypothetical protein
VPAGSSVSRARHTAPPKAHTARPKSDRAPLKIYRLFALHNLAALRDLPSVAGSPSSGLLLAAGFALVLLVIAETSFLGLARFRFGAGRVHAPSKPRPAGEPVAIRRVQLRR